MNSPSRLLFILPALMSSQNGTLIPDGFCFHFCHLNPPLSPPFHSNRMYSSTLFFHLSASLNGSTATSYYSIFSSLFLLVVKTQIYMSLATWVQWASLSWILPFHIPSSFSSLPIFNTFSMFSLILRFYMYPSTWHLILI